MKECKAAAGVSLAVLVLLLSGSAHAQTLPLITWGSASDVSFWWSGESAQSEPLDASLFAESIFVDPSGPAAPRVSRVYRVPNLSDLNARNLGDLLDASFVLVGEARYEEPAHTAGSVFWTSAVTVEARLLPVANDTMLAAIERRFTATGSTPEAALSAAADATAEYLTARVRRAIRSASSAGGVAVEGATLVISEIEQASPLVAFKRELRARGDVVADVWEAWATEGAIGLRLELSPGADWYQVSALLAELAASPGAYRLIIDEEGEMTARIRLMAGP